MTTRSSARATSPVTTSSGCSTSSTWTATSTSTSRATGPRWRSSAVGSNDLIGPDGATLEALQELTRLAVAQSTGVRSRLMLDVGEFRAKRRADLTALAGETARRVSSSGQPERLAPMNPFERKVVHDVIASAAGVHSESEGEEPNRRVVVLPDK